MFKVGCSCVVNFVWGPDKLTNWQSDPWRPEKESKSCSVVCLAENLEILLFLGYDI